MKRLLAYLLAILCLLAPAVSVYAENAEPIDAFEFFGDTKLDLEPYRGKTILLNFFTKWCPYCMEDLPDFKKAQESYSADELQIIFVHVWDGETDKETAEVKEMFGLQDAVFFEDEDFAVTQRAGVQGYPYSLFIKNDGTVLGYVGGALSYESLERIFSELQIPLAEEAE